MKNIMFYSVAIVGLVGLFLPQATKADFIVMPIPTVEIKEVCTGISVGAKIFELDISRTYETLRLGDIYSTKSGKLVQITGVRTQYDWMDYLSYYYADDSFLVAPETLPAVTHGVKGPFYYLDSGSIVFAKYL